MVYAGNCVVYKGGIDDRYCTNCQQRRMIGQYTTQLPVQTKLYRPYCAILLPVCIGSFMHTPDHIGAAVVKAKDPLSTWPAA